MQAPPHLISQFCGVFPLIIPHFTEEETSTERLCHVSWAPQLGDTGAAIKPGKFASRAHVINYCTPVCLSERLSKGDSRSALQVWGHMQEELRGGDHGVSAASINFSHRSSGLGLGLLSSASCSNWVSGWERLPRTYWFPSTAGTN